MSSSAFEENGYFVTSPLLGESECQAPEDNLFEVSISMAGSRSLLEAEWCMSLARTLKTHSSLAGFLPQEAVAVQCTYFEKSVDRNWLVSLHQDLSIPVFKKQIIQLSRVGLKKKGAFLSNLLQRLDKTLSLSAFTLTSVLPTIVRSRSFPVLMPTGAPTKKQLFPCALPMASLSVPLLGVRLWSCGPYYFTLLPRLPGKASPEFCISSSLQNHYLLGYGGAMPSNITIQQAVKNRLRRGFAAAFAGLGANLAFSEK